MICRSKFCLVCLLMLLGGCQSSWVALNGNSTSADELQAARQACRIDEKLAALKQAEIAKNNRVSKAPSNEAKMLLKDDHALGERAVRAEIEACMRQQGFEKQG